MSNLLQKLNVLNERVKNCYKDLDDLIRILKGFEEKYHLSTRVFFEEFQKGERDQSPDYFEWYAMLEMSKKVVSKLRELEKEIADGVERELFAEA
jgi:hypothetical protein